MFTFSIQCFSKANQNAIAQPHFYILNKGLNSGKPLKTPCPNCYVITVKNEVEKEFYYWLCWGLWQSKKFHHLHTGSVIPFIRLYEFKSFLKEQAATYYAEKEQYYKNIKALQQLEALEKNYKKNLILINETKRAIFHQATSKR